MWTERSACSAFPLYIAPAPASWDPVSPSNQLPAGICGTNNGRADTAIQDAKLRDDTVTRSKEDSHPHIHDGSCTPFPLGLPEGRHKLPLEDGKVVQVDTGRPSQDQPVCIASSMKLHCKCNGLASFKPKIQGKGTPACFI